MVLGHHRGPEWGKKDREKGMAPRFKGSIEGTEGGITTRFGGSIEGTEGGITPQFGGSVEGIHWDINNMRLEYCVDIFE